MNNPPPTEAEAEILREGLVLPGTDHHKIEGTEPELISASKDDERAQDDIAAMKRLPEIAGNQSIEQARDDVAAQIANKEIRETYEKQKEEDQPAQDHVAEPITIKRLLAANHQDEDRQGQEDCAEQAAKSRLRAVSQKYKAGNQLNEEVWHEKDHGFGYLDLIDMAELYDKNEQAMKNVAAKKEFGDMGAKQTDGSL